MTDCSIFDGAGTLVDCEALVNIALERSPCDGGVAQSASLLLTWPRRA